jgi:hypothetical protein
MNSIGSAYATTLLFLDALHVSTPDRMLFIIGRVVRRFYSPALGRVNMSLDARKG